MEEFPFFNYGWLQEGHAELQEENQYLEEILSTANSAVDSKDLSDYFYLHYLLKKREIKQKSLYHLAREEPDVVAFSKVRYSAFAPPRGKTDKK